MRLSIVIPHYNTPHLLRNLLDSILLECSETEVIVVDDNSTEAVEEFEQVRNDYEKKVTFLVNDSGVKGAGAARNVGLKYATGEWIMFADADDWFLEGWYEIVKNHFDSLGDIVFFCPRAWDVVKNQESHRTTYIKRIFDSYLGGSKYGELEARFNMLVVWSKLFRRGLIYDNDVLFDEVMHANDVMFSVKASLFAQRIEIDPAAVYCVSSSPGTLTKNYSLEACTTRFGVFCREFDLLRNSIPKRDFIHVLLKSKMYDKLLAVRDNSSQSSNMKICQKMLKDSGISISLIRAEYYSRAAKKWIDRVKGYFSRGISRIKGEKK